MSVSNHYTCAVIDVESVKSMDQVEFEVLITEIGRGSANAADVWNSAVIVNRLAVSRVIQDYKWPPHFYDSLWTALNLCWQEATALIIKENMSIIWKIESSIWSTLKILFKLPEFDAKVAADSCFINADTVQTLFRRVLVDSDLVSAQQCIHWIYQHRSDLRPLMRRSLCTTLLSERVSTFGARKSRQKDGGDGRDHVGSLLGVLITIIEGLSCFSQTVHINLLTHVLMPLHQPNEMVDWREQIPVLQMYHTPLVRCLKVLIEKSRMKHDLADSISRYKQHDGQLKRFSDHPKLSVPVPVSVMSCVPRPMSIPLTVSVIEVEGEKGRRSSSVLPAVIKSLNKYWPSPQAANTPKEVLMLHELEELVAMSCPVPSSSTAPSSSSADSLLSPSSSDIAEILQIFLERIVLSLGRGGNSDNFRTVQRALQVFKNKAILQLLGSSGAIVSNTSNDNETRGTDPHLYHSSLAPDDRSILQLAFTALIPALYRGGNLSWNPTVNKMTVLALRNLRDLDPDLFKTYANHLLTAGEKTGYGDTASLGVNTAQTARENDGEMARESSSRNGAAHLLLQQISSQPYANKKMKPPVPVPVPSRNPGHQATSDPQSVSTSRIVSSDGG